VTRVVVTGLGVVSPLGVGVPRFWEALVAGRNGVRRLSRFDVTGIRTPVAAEVVGFDARDHADSRSVRTSDPAALYLLAAAREAVADARLGPDVDNRRVAVVAGFDGAHESVARAALGLRRDGQRGVESYAVLQGMPATAASLVTQAFGFAGPHFAVSASCASGAAAILQAANLLRLGAADVAVAASASRLAALPLAGFSAARVLTRSDDPETASRPFELRRDGVVMGEGGAALVLEGREVAGRRGARGYAELRGGWQSSSTTGLAVNEAESAAGCIRLALESAGVRPDQVDLVGAHAAGTRRGDREEAHALGAVFGRRVPAFAAKSMLGHCMSTAGGLESVAAVLAIRDQIAPPTTNYDEPDPECDVDCVPNEARRLPVRTVLKTSFGLGGVNCCLVFRALT
jgi:3-oxoacyl-[acyl-carrier-protein] synthase II